MSSIDRKIADWFLITAEVLQKPIVELPLEELRDDILASFDARMLSSNLRDAQGRITVRGFGWSSSDPTSRAANETIATAFRSLDAGMFDFHPLLQWYARTGEAHPQSVGHIPWRFLDAWQIHEVFAMLKSLNAEQQMSIPMHVRGVEHQAVVVCRSGRDFTDQDLRLARSLQPMFSALQRQAELLASRAIPAELTGVLSGRELAVLRSIARGNTAQGTARELLVSPRTVEKHLENAYRKLGVSNRVSAVVVASQLGLVESPATR
ncbi:response regulator transcription factor [Microbacterium sp. B2969]|uniref:Response regulator transcription factor n=1 Tax=Microbacterium alkaliflavum TaxID=3248839 RepID=A0ABW7Q2X6_9MICO